MGRVKELLFNEDPFEGLERKRRGIGRMEESHGNWIDTARKVLLNSGLDVVTSDDLHRLLRVAPPHPNAVGAVFHCESFVPTGRRVKSKRPEAHGREIKEWRIKR